MRKLVSLLLATLLCVSLLTGCANNVDSTQPTNSVHDGTGTSTETREKVVLWMSGDDARYLVESGLVEKFNENQMIISKNPQFTGISARQQLEFTTHLLLTD